LVVVASGCTLERHEGASTIRGLEADDVGDDDGVRVGGVHVRHRFVDAAGRPFVGRDPGPVLAPVVGAIDAGAWVARLDSREDSPRVRRRDAELGVDQARWQSLLQLLPRGAAVGRLEDAAVGALPGAVLPWPLPL